MQIKDVSAPIPGFFHPKMCAPRGKLRVFPDCGGFCPNWAAFPAGGGAQVDLPEAPAGAQRGRAGTPAPEEEQQEAGGGEGGFGAKNPDFGGVPGRAWVFTEFGARPVVKLRGLNARIWGETEEIRGFPSEFGGSAPKFGSLLSDFGGFAAKFGGGSFGEPPMGSEPQKPLKILGYRRFHPKFEWFLWQFGVFS